jgi:hypothetical protein
MYCFNHLFHSNTSSKQYNEPNFSTALLHQQNYNIYSHLGQTLVLGDLTLNTLNVCKPKGSTAFPTTSFPSVLPTRSPITKTPTDRQPTQFPTVTIPSTPPTRSPSQAPSHQPSKRPSTRPSEAPVGQPSLMPSTTPSSLSPTAVSTMIALIRPLCDPRCSCSYFYVMPRSFRS